MMAGPSILDPNAFVSEPVLEVLNTVFGMQFRWIFAVLIVVTFIDAVKSIVLAVKGRVPQA